MDPLLQSEVVFQKGSSGNVTPCLRILHRFLPEPRLSSRFLSGLQAWSFGPISSPASFGTALSPCLGCCSHTAFLSAPRSSPSHHRAFALTLFFLKILSPNLCIAGSSSLLRLSPQGLHTQRPSLTTTESGPRGPLPNTLFTVFFQAPITILFIRFLVYCPALSVIKQASPGQGSCLCTHYCVLTAQNHTWPLADGKHLSMAPLPEN